MRLCCMLKHPINRVCRRRNIFYHPIYNIGEKMVVLSGILSIQKCLFFLVQNTSFARTRTFPANFAQLMSLCPKWGSYGHFTHHIFFFFPVVFSLKMGKKNEKWKIKRNTGDLQTTKNTQSPEMGYKKRFVIHIERKDFGKCGWYIDFCVPNTKQRVQHVFEDMW